MDNGSLPKHAADAAAAVLKFLEKSETEYIKNRRVRSMNLLKNDIKGETADEN